MSVAMLLLFMEDPFVDSLESVASFFGHKTRKDEHKVTQCELVKINIHSYQNIPSTLSKETKQNIFAVVTTQRALSPPHPAKPIKHPEILIWEQTNTLYFAPWWGG